MLTLDSRPSRAGLAVLAAFALISVFFTGLFPRFTNPNELSRFEAVYAVVENGTFAIDRALAVLGDREDKAVSGGHFYSNKAPGLALVGIPVYRALRIFLPRPISPSEPLFVLLRLFTVTLGCGIAVAVLLRRLRPLPEGPLVVFALVFGTPFGFYARTFFSHSWTASLLFLSWDLIRRREDHLRPLPPAGGEGRGEGSWPSALLDVAAGLLAAWAALSEYTAAPLAGLLAIRAAGRGGFKRLALFCAGAVVPLALLLYYNAACFGSPWVLSSAREARSDYAELAGRGLFGFGLPSPRIAFYYLFDAGRGLLWRSPFWLWLVPGFVAWRRSREERADRLFTSVALVGYFVMMAGYGNWHGGWTLGNRYLVPIVLFGGLALSRSLESPLARGLFALASVLSAACHFVLAASWPYFPYDVEFPAARGSLWYLERGWEAPNLLPSTGSWALAVPLLAIAAAGFLALRACRPGTPRLALAVPAGLVLFAATLLPASAPSYSVQLWRAGVYGAFSPLDPRREELARVVAAAKTPAEQRMARGAWRTFGP